jgi:hypothetical protein
MVPSDPQFSLLSSRHARPERGIRWHHRFSHRSPRQPFGPPQLVAPEDDSFTFLMEPAFGSDLSLPRSDCPFPNHRHRLGVPGLPLQRLAEPVSGSFGSELPTRGSGFPDRVAHRPEPVSCTSVRQSRRFLSLCSPSGPFDPSGSALGSVCRPEAHLRRTSDCPSLPADETFNRNADGSPFQARLVPRGSPFHEPLGTIPIIPLIQISVKYKIG